MLRLTFELAQNRSQQFNNKLLTCLSLIPRSAAEDDCIIDKPEHKSHAQSHTRLPAADLVLTLISPACGDLFPPAGLESPLFCSIHASRHHRSTEAVC